MLRSEPDERSSRIGIECHVTQDRQVVCDAVVAVSRGCLSVAVWRTHCSRFSMSPREPTISPSSQTMTHRPENRRSRLRLRLRYRASWPASERLPSLAIHDVAAALLSRSVAGQLVSQARTRLAQPLRAYESLSAVRHQPKDQAHRAVTSPPITRLLARLR